MCVCVSLCMSAISVTYVLDYCFFVFQYVGMCIILSPFTHTLFKLGNVK